MPRRRKDLAFEESLFNNMNDYYNLRSRLIDLTVGRFKLEGLPEYMDKPFIIRMFVSNPKTLFAFDPDLQDLDPNGRFLWYTYTLGASSGKSQKLQDVLTQNRVSSWNDIDSKDRKNITKTEFRSLFNEYNIPYYRRVVLPNSGYTKIFSWEDSVIVRSSYSETPILPIVEEYARKLYIISRTIDLNVNAQKTPLIVVCDEDMRLTMENLLKQYQGNVPFVIGDRAQISADSIKAVTTGAPFVADKLFDLKMNTWNEFLTFLGIYNISVNKKERLITDEVQRSMGGVLVARNNIVHALKDSFDEINKKWKDINIKFTFGEDDPSEEEIEEIKDLAGDDMEVKEDINV